MSTGELELEFLSILEDDNAGGEALAGQQQIP